MKIVFVIASVLVAISWQKVLAEDTHSSTRSEKTFIVAPQTIDCYGIIPMKCLGVKESPSDDKWSYMYSDIEGFDYEPGFEYVLKVQTEKIANPPADGSSIKYTLLEQISKTKMLTN